MDRNDLKLRTPQLAQLASRDRPDVARALLGSAHELSGLTFVATACLVVGFDLYGRGRLRLARPALGVTLVCSVVLGGLTMPGAAFGLAVGITAGLGVRVALGVLSASSTEETLLRVLAGNGWGGVAGLRPVELSAGRARYHAVDRTSGALTLTVVDPDWRGVAFGRRAWRFLRLRTAVVGRLAASRQAELERQALAVALAQQAGIVVAPVLALLKVGAALVLVQRRPQRLPANSARQPGQSTDAMRALRRLHDAGVAHTAIDAQAVVIYDDGRVGFTDLSAAQPAATALQLDLDLVALLVVAGQEVGPAVAVAAMRSGYGTTPDSELRLAGVLQPIALSRQLRHVVRKTVLLADLRTLLNPPDANQVTAVRLERLRPRTVVSVAAGTFAAYILATQISQVDVTGAVRQARIGWLLAAVGGSAATYVGAALSLRAFTPIRVPLGRTIQVQVASAFATLVTPPAVGHLGLNLRFLQRAGVSIAAAGAALALKETVTIAVTVPVLLICG